MRHTTTHSTSFMTHYDAQCDFGNLKHWQIFKMQKYDLEDFFSFILLNEWCTVHHCATIMLAVLYIEGACSQPNCVYRLSCAVQYIRTQWPRARFILQLEQLEFRKIVQHVQLSACTRIYIYKWLQHCVCSLGAWHICSIVHSTLAAVCRTN